MSIAFSGHIGNNSQAGEECLPEDSEVEDLNQEIEYIDDVKDIL